MILVTHFACCHQYKGYWRSCPLGWSYFTVMPGLNLRAGGAYAPEFTADGNATIYGAWEQINLRYWRDIPHLLHYCPLACISDGVKTRLGTVRTPYEHFYAWRRVNDGDKVSPLPFDEVQTMIKGVYSPKRFLEIFRDYIYFRTASMTVRNGRSSAGTRNFLPLVC